MAIRADHCLENSWRRGSWAGIRRMRDLRGNGSLTLDDDRYAFQWQFLKQFNFAYGHSTLLIWAGRLESVADIAFEFSCRCTMPNWSGKARRLTQLQVSAYALTLTN
jgi:hypothetical protein